MRKILDYLKPYAGVYCLAGVLILLTAFADLALPGIMKNIVNTGIGKRDTGFIIQQGILMLVITLLNLLFWFLASYLGAKASFYFARDLRKDTFGCVLKSSVDQADDIGTASLITRTTNDVAALEMISFRILRMGAIAPFTCIGGIVLAFRSSAEISLVFFLAVPLLALVYWFIIRKATPLFTATFPKTDAINRIIRENLTGIRVIRAFNHDNAEKARFDRANIDLTETNIKAQRVMAWQSPLTTLIMDITVLAILYFGTIRIDRGTFMVGDLIAMTQYATIILGALARLSMVFQMLPRSRAAAKRINEVLNLKSTLSVPNVGAEQTPKNYDLSFSNVSFSYGGSERPVLDNVSFTAESGKTTAIIGGTGAGKSTIMQLILRFYDVRSGAICIGGVDVRKMDTSKLRSMIGYAAQRVELFSGSISENIGYGCSDICDEALREAAQTAQAVNFIEAQREGYNAFIAQAGKNFSGGQKQRLSIARALARKAPLLLFDDSFSALDYKTDAELRKALREKESHATVLIVAQRVATVMNADKIIVLNQGKVEDIGTHYELLKRCDFYKELVYSQLSRQKVTV